MAVFSDSGLSQNPNFTDGGDLASNACWHPNGELWVVVTRYDAGAVYFRHWLDRYDPTTGLWSTPIDLVFDITTEKPLTYSHTSRSLVINKHGTAMFLWASGASSGGPGLHYRFIYDDLSLSAISSVLNLNGLPADGADSTIAQSIALTNNCTDFVCFFEDTLTPTGRNITALDVSSDDLSQSNRRVIYDGREVSDFGAAYTIVSMRGYSHPKSGLVSCAFLVIDTGPANPDPHYFVFSTQENGAVIHHVDDTVEQFSGFAPSFPVFLPDNIDPDSMYAVYGVASNASDGIDTFILRKFESGVSVWSSAIFSALHPSIGTTYEMQLDGAGNLYICHNNDTTLSHSASGGDGYGCIKILRGSMVVQDLGVVARYRNPTRIPSGLSRTVASPRNNDLSWIVRIQSSGDAGIFINTLVGEMDGIPSSFDGDAGDCAGVEAVERDSELYVWDDRAYTPTEVVVE